MLALVIALVASAAITPQALAQEEYKVLSSIVLTRTGERTPDFYGSASTILTSLGANQAYAQGQFFRERYLTSSGSTNGVDGARLYNVDPTFLNVDDVAIVSLDTQYNVATAQAFVQGLYPPFSPELTGSSVTALLNPTGTLANGSYVDAPLGGYQYAQVHAANGMDPSFLYLSANLNCPAFDSAAAESMSSAEYVATRDASADIYEAVGSAMLDGVVSSSDWSYDNAYAIFDYLSYQNSHNSTAAAELAKLYNTDTNTSYLSTLQVLADQQQYAELGNLTASPALPDVPSGSISTIAGNIFASFVLSEFLNTILLGQLSALQPVPQNVAKLILLFADYQPFLSFFALASLPAADIAFTGLPQFAASLAFELFTYANISEGAPFPLDADDLWVRVSLRNGSDPTAPFQAFPLFQNSPSNTDLRWADFYAAMEPLAMSSVGAWCDTCQATSVFCSPLNASTTANAASEEAAGCAPHAVSLVVAGVVGAAVGLASAALLFLVCTKARSARGFLARWRRGGDSGALAGFRGNLRMQSDQDLVIPKGGASVGAVVEREGPMGAPPGAHERHGSWELKQAESGKTAGLDDDWGIDVLGRKAKPLEHV